MKKWAGSPSLVIIKSDSYKFHENQLINECARKKKLAKIIEELRSFFVRCRRNCALNKMFCASKLINHMRRLFDIS